VSGTYKPEVALAVFLSTHPAKLRRSPPMYQRCHRIKESACRLSNGRAATNLLLASMVCWSLWGGRYDLSLRDETNQLRSVMRNLDALMQARDREAKASGVKHPRRLH
jgi:hypothetical protein